MFYLNSDGGLWVHLDYLRVSSNVSKGSNADRKEKN